MTTYTIILVVLILLVVICAVLSLLGFLEIGIIIDDHYVFSPKEARRGMNKKPYYLQSGVVFLCLGLMFLMCLFRALTGIRGFQYAAYGIAFAAMVYAVVSHYSIKKAQADPR